MSTTYDVYFQLTSSVGGTFKVLVRAAPLADAQDAGCMLDTTSFMWFLAATPANANNGIAFTAPTNQGFPFHLRVTFVPNGTQYDVRCSLRGAINISVITTMDLPPGFVGK